ncbi:MAG TPA: trigger factor [Gammaproteobacteria bacterium]|nr:trigger factor [Gammaproteobacteria bacterium]
MQVSVTTTEGLERRMSVEVPADRVDQEVQQRLKSMSGSVRMAGFRPGKVPFKVIQQRYGAQVRQEVQAELLRSTLYEALQQENLRPAGAPKVELDASEGSNLAYTATFEIYPEVDVTIPKETKVEKLVADITDQDVDNMIEKLRKQRASWATVERAAQDGDQLVIDFIGKIEGEAFEGGEAKDYPLTLGAGRFIAGFEELLIGSSAGETKDVTVTFPEDYQNEELAGKEAVFSVTVKEVKEPTLPALDDREFMQALGVSEGGVEELKAEVKSSMERELAQTIAAKFKNDVLEAVLEANPVELPQALVDSEIQIMMNEARQSMGMPPAEGEQEINDEIRAAFEEKARRRVALGLLIGEILKEQGIKADADKVRERIEEQASSYEDPESVINWYYQDRSRLSGVEALVLEDQVVDWIAEQFEVEETAKSFDEVMQSGAPS